MSQNHPHDNIYSILGKLEALKPTTQELHDATVKQIQESVEAQGSIIKGLREIGSTESRLARQFAESKIEEKAVSQAQQKFMGMVHAAQKGKKAASPEVAKVAKSMGKKDAQDFASTKHAGLPKHVAEKYDPVKAVKQCAKNAMEMNGIASVHDLDAEDIEYIGDECQMNYHDVCEILGIQLPDSLGPVDSFGPDEHGNIVDFEEGVIGNIKNTVRAANYDRLANRSNAQAVAGGGFSPPPQYKALSAKGDERSQKAANIRKAVDDQKALDNHAGYMFGPTGVDYDNLKANYKESTCNECGMYESKCSCNHDMNEGIGDSIKMAWAKTISWVLDKAINMSKDPVYKKRAKELLAQETAKAEQLMLSKIAGHPREEQLKQQVHYIVTQLNQQTTMSGFINTAQKLFTQLQAEREKFGEGKVTHPEKGVTRHTKTDFPGYPSDDLEKDDDDKDAPKSKGGKGRPRKATTKNPRRDPDAPKKSRGRPSKHSTGEKSSSDNLPFSSKNKVGHDLFGRVKSSAHKSVTESVNFKRMLDEQHMTLEEMIACMQEDMLQFKKTGVCSERLRDMMEVYAHAKKQMEETIDPTNPRDYEIPAVQRKAQNQAPLTMQDVRAKDQKAAMDFQRRVGNVHDEDPMEAELNELAKLAGLSEVSRGEYIKQQDANAEHAGKKDFNAFGQLFRTDDVKEDPQAEFEGKGLEDDNVKIGDKIPGTNAIKTKDIDEDKIDVKTAPDAVNKPKKKYFSMRASTLNPGEGDNGEKRMYPQHPAGDNGMTQPARTTPVKEDALSLESRLAAEYESIKKVS